MIGVPTDAALKLKRNSHFFITTNQLKVIFLVTGRERKFSWDLQYAKTSFYKSVWKLIFGGRKFRLAYRGCRWL